VLRQPYLFCLPLDEAYFWIYDAPGCDTHYERWRLEINPPATFSTCSTEGRQSQVSFGIIEISGDPTVKLCWFLYMFCITCVFTFELLGFVIV